MLDFNYYVIVVYIKNDRKSYPNFITCAKTKTDFIRIANLESFLVDGKSGLSDDKFDLGSTYFLISDNYGWKGNLALINF